MLPFVGPSYQLATRKASAQRSVNMHLVPMETASKDQFIMDSVPGLALLVDAGAVIRGMFSAGSRSFIVAGATLFELNANNTLTSRGTLLTASGVVQIEYGLFQLVIVDGLNGYVLVLATNVFSTISAPGFYGSATVGFIGNYFTFIRPGTQQFEISAINDATVVNALDFASAEQLPDNLVGQLVDHGEVWLFGELSTEIWAVTGAVDFPLAKRLGVSIEVGLAARYSAKKVDSGVFWIGKDSNGSGIVYRNSGYQPLRISTRAVEEALQASTDLSAAVAYVYQDGGLTFYCINAPGLKSTWCFEVSTSTWHERADVDLIGQFMAHRATHFMQAFGNKLVGAANGKIYRVDKTLYQFAGDPIVRERTSPQEATPTLMRQIDTASCPPGKFCRLRLLPAYSRTLA